MRAFWSDLLAGAVALSGVGLAVWTIVLVGSW